MDMLKGAPVMLTAMMLSLQAMAAIDSKPAATASLHARSVRHVAATRVVPSVPVIKPAPVVSSSTKPAPVVSSNTKPAPVVPSNVKPSHVGAAVTASLAASSPKPTEASLPEEVPAEEVLPDGAQIVAGDPDKNEFFIVGKGQPIPEVKMERIKHLEKLPEAPAKPQLAVVPKQHKLPIKDLTPHHRKELAFNEVPKPNVIVVHGEYREKMRPVLERRIEIYDLKMPPLPQKYMAASLKAELTKSLRMTEDHIPAPDLSRTVRQYVHKSGSKEYMAQILKQALKPSNRRLVYRDSHQFRGLMTNAEYIKKEPAKLMEQPAQYVGGSKPNVVTGAALVSSERKAAAQPSGNELNESMRSAISTASIESKQQLTESVDLKRHIKLAAKRRANPPAGVERIVDVNPLAANSDNPESSGALNAVGKADRATVVASTSNALVDARQAPDQAVDLKRHVKLAARGRAVSPTSHVRVVKAKQLAANPVSKRRSARKVSIRNDGIEVISIADAERAKQLARKAGSDRVSGKKQVVRAIASSQRSTSGMGAKSVRRDKRQVVLTDSDYEVVYNNSAFTVKKLQVRG